MAIEWDLIDCVIFRQYTSGNQRRRVTAAITSSGTEIQAPPGTHQYPKSQVQEER